MFIYWLLQSHLELLKMIVKPAEQTLMFKLNGQLILRRMFHTLFSLKIYHAQTLTSALSPCRTGGVMT